MAENPYQQFKKEALKELPDEAGVYALCDLDEKPIYVGQAASSKDTSIRKRVQRHLTSARSDIIANRQIDVWEIAYVWGWVLPDADERNDLEGHLYYEFDKQCRLANGTVPTKPGKLRFTVPEPVKVQVMDDKVIESRRDPALRFPRQIQHFGGLVDYILNTQDKPHLRRAVEVHFERLQRHLQRFLDG